MIDILLVNPAFRSRPFYIQPPLGLAALGAFVEREGFSVKIIDLEIRPPRFDLGRILAEERPRIVGIGGTSQSRFDSFTIADLAKSMADPPWTVYGGAHATFAAEDTLRRVPRIDYIVRDEGEVTFLELTKALLRNEGDPAKIAGLSYRADEQIVHNPLRPRIRDLDIIPHGRHLLEMERYTLSLDFLGVPGVMIITSRGCPFKCNYCVSGAMFGAAYTMRSPGHVADEIEYCIKRIGIKGIKFYDSALTINKGHMLRVLEELRRRKINLPWECEIKANTVDRELLRTMKENGCYYMDLGAESGSDEVLRAIHKGNTVRQAVEAMNWCHELGIKTKVFFSFGHTGETLDQAKETIRFINRCRKRIDRLSKAVGILVFPGTDVERYAVANSLLGDGFRWSKPLAELDPSLVFSGSVPILTQPQFDRNALKTCRVLLYRAEIKRLLSSPRAIWQKGREIGGPKQIAKVIGHMAKNLVGKFRP